MTTPQPTPDSRAEKLRGTEQWMGVLPWQVIQYIERAGLLVLDPQDPAVVERITAVLDEGRFSSSLRAVALAVIAALVTPGGAE